MVSKRLNESILLTVAAHFVVSEIFLISNMRADYPWAMATLDHRGMVRRINVGDYCAGLF